MKTNTINKKEMTITSKGQITLPIAWRRKVGEPQKIQVVERNGILEIHPVHREGEWTTIFQAPKDGPRMPIDDFISLIEDINDKQDRKIS